MNRQRMKHPRPSIPLAIAWGLRLRLIVQDLPLLLKVADLAEQLSLTFAGPTSTLFGEGLATANAS